MPRDSGFLVVPPLAEEERERAGLARLERHGDVQGRAGVETSACPAREPRAVRARRRANVPERAQELAAIRGERDEGLARGEERDARLEIHARWIAREDRAEVGRDGRDDVPRRLRARRTDSPFGVRERRGGGTSEVFSSVRRSA